MLVAICCYNICLVLFSLSLFCFFCFFLFPGYCLRFFLLGISFAPYSDKFWFSVLLFRFVDSSSASLLLLFMLLLWGL